jgi:glycosyltransferase involved in cell wall biosynthesis
MDELRNTKILIITTSPHPVIVEEYNEIKKHVGSAVFVMFPPLKVLIMEFFRNIRILIHNIKLVLLFLSIVSDNFTKLRPRVLLRSYLNLLYLLILDKKEPFTTIHAHWLYPSGLIAITYSKYLHKKVVVSIHGYDADERTFKNKRLKHVALDVARKSDWIISGDKTMYDTFIGYDIRNIILANYFIDISKFECSTEDVVAMKREIGIDQNSFTIIFGPRLTKMYGAIDFTEAIIRIHHQIPNLFVVCMGRGDLTELTDMAFRRAGIHYKLTGDIPHTEVKKLLNLGDVLCYPCHLAQGILVLEAYACNKPVIAYNVKVAKVEDGVTGLLATTGDHLMLANLMVKLYNDEALREKMGQEGKRKLIREYDKHKRIMSILRCYKD